MPSNRKRRAREPRQDLVDETNLHATLLREILTGRGIHLVTVGSNAWKVTNGMDRLVTYYPETAECLYFDHKTESHRRVVLLGAPPIVANLLEGMVR